MQFYSVKKLLLNLYNALNIHGVKSTEPSEVITENKNAEPQKSAFYAFNLKLSHYNTLNNEYSFYHFFIENKHRTILKQPNRIEYIKFNNSQLALSDDVKPPDILDWSFISVYTHKNAIPLLIQIISSERNYFYSPDPETGKWTSYSMNNLKGYEQVDENDINCYTPNGYDTNKLNEDISEECFRLSERFRNDHDTTGNTTKDPSLEICIQLTEILSTSAPLAEDGHFTRPKLELSSFRGEGSVRIQTYTLEVESPVARVVLLHGHRCTFPSEFLNYNPTYFDNASDCELKENILHHLKFKEGKIELKYKYGDDLVSTEELKSMVCGQIQLEDRSIYIYKDGTDGWVTTDKYVYEGSPAQAFNLNNISVHGLDLRSFGASESPEVWRVGRIRAMLDDFDYMVKDLITFVKVVKEKYNDDLPIYLIGVSMGGTVAARALELLGTEKLVDGAILVAPMLKPVIGGIYNKIFRHAKWILDTMIFLSPKRRAERGGKICESDDKLGLNTDDMYCPNNYIYLSSAVNFLKGIDSTLKHRNKIDSEIPLLFVHSTADDVCGFEGTEEFYDSLTQVKRKYFIRLNCMTHNDTILHRHFVPIAEFTTHWIVDINKEYEINQ